MPKFINEPIKGRVGLYHRQTGGKMKLLIAMAVAVTMANVAEAKITLTPDNHCYLDEAVDAGTMYDMKQCLAKQSIKRGAKSYTIYLVLDSPGGSIYEGLRFIEFAETIKNVETVTIYAASMAAVIAQALPGQRHMTRNGIMMFHRAKGSFSGQFGEGELESKLALWKHIVAKMEIKAANRIKITHADYKNKVRNEWWLYGDQAVKKRTADRVSQVVCSVELVKGKRKKKQQTFMGPIEYTVSNCPMMN